MRILELPERENLQRSGTWRLNKGRVERLQSVWVFLLTFVTSLWVFRPRQHYFYGDSWSVLDAFVNHSKTVFVPHVVHLIPLFKLFLLLEYRLFAGDHLPYMVIGLAIHSAVGATLYKLARQISLSPAAACAVALMFAFTSVHWEVTGWSFCQCLELSSLAGLAAISTFLNGEKTLPRLTAVVLLCLVGLLFGPVASVVAPALSVQYVLSVLLENKSAGQQPTPNESFWILAFLWLPVLIYGVCLYFAEKVAFGGVPGNPHFYMHQLPAMLDFTVYGVLYGLLLPSLGFLNPTALVAAPALMILICLFFAAGYLKTDERQRVTFWFLWILVIFPIAAASLIRLSSGLQAGAASRYQYLPAAGLALICVMCWEAARARLSTKAARATMNAVGILLLAVFLSGHVYALRNPEYNPALARNILGRHYLAYIKTLIVPVQVPAGGVVLGPEMMLPHYLYAPGEFPLWAALQVVHRDSRQFLPIAKFAPSEFVDNLLTDENRSLASHDRGRVVTPPSVLEPGHDYSRQLMSTCPRTLQPAVLTFIARVASPDGAQLRATLLFRDVKMRLLPSQDNPEDLASAPLGMNIAVSGLLPPNSCGVSLEITNVGNSSVQLEVSQAKLVAHPAVFVGGVVHSSRLRVE